MKKFSIKDCILFENDNYILMNKPPYVASLDERDSTRDNMLGLLREYCPEGRLCHRLDKETSGVLVAAKNDEAYRNLSIQFENREVSKVYHAVVGGVQNFNETKVNWPIAVSGRGNVRIDTVEGKPSLTIFNTLEAYKSHTLVECLPYTGRMHQIRIHLASLEAPIAADILYGGKFPFLSDIKRKFNLKQQTEEQALIKRVALHARAIVFNDVNGEPIAAEADYPKDIRAFVNQLRKNK
ncbi:RluA family pseudouridine synthase [Sediminitomix flava]|uniref:23S rRNA pseudouridine955/2504/2580 synthase n=1 Tax=Sediminitomix flava TaxID=379075 RepID=A0A315Z800_SEDFL|nr:RluA family pseudouridine synthase [Sediminitomix flava]PWJ39320.1 23S rRNA pseudouridine955/2504/2580 synthase [Sediminitomix flava]